MLDRHRVRLFIAFTIAATLSSYILISAIFVGMLSNDILLITYASAKSGHHHPQASSSNNDNGSQKQSNPQQQEQQGSCPDGSQPDVNGNCPTPNNQQQQITQSETGTIYVQVNGGEKKPQDFTLHIVITSGQGSANPSDFQGSESGTTVTFSGNALYDLAANQDPNYTRSYGSDCPAPGSQFPSSFTCHIIYSYNPSPTTSTSGTPTSSESTASNQTSPSTSSSSTTSSSQQPLTNLVPPSQLLSPSTTTTTTTTTTSPTSSPSGNSTSTPSSSQQPLTNLASPSQRLAGITPTGSPSPNSTTSAGTTSSFPQPSSANKQEQPSPPATLTMPITTSPATIPGNQTTNSTAGLRTFYVYVSIDNTGGGTKTLKDVTVSWPDVFKGEPCGITGGSGSFPVTPSSFPASETGTPVKVSTAADFCASPDTSLDFKGYQPQYTVKTTIPGKSVTDFDCFLLPLSGACHMILHYIPTSTGTPTNKTTSAGTPQPSPATTATTMKSSPNLGTATNTNTNTNTNINNNTNTNVNTNTNTNLNTNTNTLINRQTIENTVKINNEVNNVIKSASQTAASTAITTATSPSSKSPLVDLETVQLGKSTFPSGGIRPLADVNPFQIIGGHVSINSPNPNVNIIVAQITDSGVQHAVILDLKNTAAGIPGETLYHTDLGQIITGTNPFTGKPDTILHITDLLLYNNSVSGIQFNDDSELTMTIIYR
jgi:hypothetical protein